MNKTLLSLFSFLIFSPSAIASEPWTKQGEFTLEARQFVDDEIDDSFESQASLKAKFNFSKETDENEVKINFGLRGDSVDPDRNRIWPEDIYVKNSYYDNTYVTFGYKIFHFSSMEAFHPFDVANAKILDVSILETEKIGELTVGVETEIYGGEFGFFILPNPTRPILPTKSSRVQLPRDLNRAEWLGTNENEQDWDDHFYIHYDKSLDELELQFIVHKGIDRERVIVGSVDYSIVNNLAIPSHTDFATPFYYERFLSGFNFVYNFESFQLKGSLAHSYYLSNTDVYNIVEGLKFPNDHTVYVLGVEKAIEHSGGLESTFIAEVQYITVSEGERDEFALQNDIFLAWKLGFNDVHSKELTVTMLRDLEGKNEGAYTIDFSRRLTDSWKVKVGAMDYLIPKNTSLTDFGLFKDMGNGYVHLTYFY